MRTGLELFESLPLPATTSIVAAIAMTITAVVLWRFSLRAGWIAAIITPLVVSYSVYWLPVWLRGESSNAEYSAWQYVFLVVWGGTSLIACLFVVVVWKWLRRSQKIGTGKKQQ